MTVSLVTGSSTGIGRAIALRLAREGHTVFGSVRSKASGAELLSEAGDLDLSLVVMDVDTDESVSAGIGSVLDQTGRIDVLVNNAGISGGLQPVEEISIDVLESAINTNVMGGVRCIKAVVPGMRERGQGAIINVTSAAGRKVLAGQGGYAASKHAMEAITEALAAETAPFGIKVAAVEPGVVLTPIFTKPPPVPGNPDSPYPSAARMRSYFMGALSGSPTEPQDVADSVWQILTSEDPELRHPVGEDALRMTARRSDFTDEEWVAAQAVADDDDWWTFVTDVTGIEPPEH
jgi:NAD(P)-dependent dehydrogenase (short-subunit alcohol dehydrogenase family)